MRDICDMDPTDEVPVIKSKRLSKSTLFKFASLFNSFHCDFKYIKDRKEFKEKIESYFYESIQDPNCLKEFCKICNPAKYKERISSFILPFEKCFDYHRYEIPENF